MTEQNNNGPKVHRYIHLFKDKETIMDVTVDFSENHLKFSSKYSPPITIYNYNEYYYWIYNIVQPDITSRLSNEQIKVLNKEGYQLLKSIGYFF